jgi:hypothetical protein
VEGTAAVSWAAHQFEYYALQGHLPRRWLGKVSFLAIVVGDQSCDLVGKFWTYGFDIGGTHYGPDEPAQWHRGFPGLGMTHSILWAFVAAGITFLLTRNRAWTLGIGLGAAIHVLSDIGDSVGTMLGFPFTTQNFSIGAWAYAATADGGKYLDAAAYYSSWGFVMDAVWLVIALTAWRCLTHAYWREQIVRTDPTPWAWLARRLPERALVTLYRAWFIYATCRFVAWTAWAHVIEDFQWDLRWGGPGWIPQAQLSHPDPLAAIVALTCALVVIWVAVTLVLKAPPSVWTKRPRLRRARRGAAEPLEPNP